MHDLIQLRNISKNYRLGDSMVTALHEVNFSIARGGIVALMGPSGSGKSTILNLIGALDTPTQGEILVNNIPVARLSRDQQAEFRSQTVGFIFQTFNLIPVLTTIENVILPAHFSPEKDTRQLKERAKSLLERVGLGQQINQSVNKLSGGQMQRVAIARALMNKPPIILADEPTANLDRGTANTVLTILKELCASERTTVVVATHDHHVLTYCYRCINLSDGRVISDANQISLVASIS